MSVRLMYLILVASAGMNAAGMARGFLISWIAFGIIVALTLGVTVYLLVERVRN